jgi:hypothetical protein
MSLTSSSVNLNDPSRNAEENNTRSTSTSVNPNDSSRNAENNINAMATRPNGVLNGLWQAVKNVGSVVGNTINSISRTGFSPQINLEEKVFERGELDRVVATTNIKDFKDSCVEYVNPLLSVEASIKNNDETIKNVLYKVKRGTAYLKRRGVEIEDIPNEEKQ